MKLTEYLESFYLRLTGVNQSNLSIYKELVFINKQLADLIILLKEQSCKKKD